MSIFDSIMRTEDLSVSLRRSKLLTEKTLADAIMGAPFDGERTMIFKKRKPKASELSPYLRDIWGFVQFRYLILAKEGFIVFIDDDLEVDWKSTPDWDEARVEGRSNFNSILNRVATIESGDWDGHDNQKTLKFKRQVGEAVARGLDGNFEGAMEMLDKAEEYRKNTLAAMRRREAVRDQVNLKDAWRRYSTGWTTVHYTIGISAILLSTLVASKPVWLSEAQVSFVAWLVAAFTGLLTFLTPDKKADKYVRAWSVLNGEIARYNATESHTVEDVLDACRHGESIVYETSSQERKKSRTSRVG